MAYYDLYTRPDELGLEEEENPFLRRPTFAPYGPLVQPPVVQPTTPIEQGLDVLPWDVQPPAPPEPEAPVGLDALPEDVEPPGGGLDELPEGVEPPWFGKRKAEIDPTKYDTKLTPEQETEFQDWKTKNAPQDSGEDYDLRGAFKAGIVADPETGHMPDRWKKPNHPTFSVESRYAEGSDKDLAGSWDKKTGAFIPPEELSPFAVEAGARVGKEAVGGVGDVVAGVPGLVAHITSGERNPYMGVAPADAAKDLTGLQETYNKQRDELIAMTKKPGYKPADAGDLSFNLGRTKKLLNWAQDAAAGKAEQSIVGTYSGAVASNEAMVQDWTKKAEDWFAPYISKTRDSNYLMKVFGSIGGTAPSLAISMMNRVAGFGAMFLQQFEQSKREFKEKKAELGQPVDEIEAGNYGVKQSVYQTPWELLGDIPFATAIKGLFSKVPAAVANGGKKAVGQWLVHNAKELGQTTLGETLVTTPMQTLTQQEIDIQMGLRPPMTWGERFGEVGEQSKVALGQSLLLAGGPMAAAGTYHQARGNFAAADKAAAIAEQLGVPPATGTAAPPGVPPPPPPGPTPPEAFAPPAAPGVTIEPAPSMEVPITPEVRQGLWAQAPPPAPAIAPEIQEGLLRRQLAEIDQTLDQTVDQDQRAPLVLQRAEIETKLLAKQAVDTTKQQVENLQASNAPKTAEALAVTTKEGIDQATVRLDQMITEVTPAGTFAEEEAAPTGEERFAPPPPAPAAVAQPAPAPAGIEVPISPQVAQGLAARPAPVPVIPPPTPATIAPVPATRPRLAEVVPERVIGQRPPPVPTPTAQLPVQAPVPPTAIVPTQPGEEVVTRPGIKGQEAVVARPSAMIAGPLKGVTVNVEGIAPNGDRMTTQQDATDALMEAKKDRTAFQLLLDCLT